MLCSKAALQRLRRHPKLHQLLPQCRLSALHLNMPQSSQALRRTALQQPRQLPSSLVPHREAPAAADSPLALSSRAQQGFKSTQQTRPPRGWIP